MRSYILVCSTLPISPLHQWLHQMGIVRRCSTATQSRNLNRADRMRNIWTTLMPRSCTLNPDSQNRAPGKLTMQLCNMSKLSAIERSSSRRQWPEWFGLSDLPEHNSALNWIPSYFELNLLISTSHCRRHHQHDHHNHYHQPRHHHHQI